MENICIKKIIENKNSECVRLHISNLQLIIQRMANNSASCKTWCITIFSAIFVFLLDKDKINYSLILSIPILLFLFLDTYYLYQERFFRKQYDIFQKSLNKEDFDYKTVYSIISSNKTDDKKNEKLCLYISTMKSPSIYVYYGFLILVLIFI